MQIQILQLFLDGVLIYEQNSYTSHIFGTDNWLMVWYEFGRGTQFAGDCVGYKLDTTVMYIDVP